MASGLCRGWSASAAEKEVRRQPFEQRKSALMDDRYFFHATEDRKNHAEYKQTVLDDDDGGSDTEPEDEDEDEFLEDLDGDVPTSAMDKRAKWMEVQLAKLEELHRDVNTAAARAILATNDRGWDIRGCLPHIGNTLARFEHLGHIDEGGKTRRMTPEEVEKKLIVGKEAAVFAETELREAMQSVIAQKP